MRDNNAFIIIPRQPSSLISSINRTSSPATIGTILSDGKKVRSSITNLCGAENPSVRSILSSPFFSDILPDKFALGSSTPKTSSNPSLDSLPHYEHKHSHTHPGNKA